jgi:hypothetical protein
MCEPLKSPTTIPPIIPEIIPEIMGAPDASAIPKHSGNATKNTTKPDKASLIWNRFFLSKVNIVKPFIMIK